VPSRFLLKPAIRIGTIVEKYLEQRGELLLDDLPGRVVRFHPELPWNDDNDNLIHVRAMIVAMRCIRTDELRAVQCTALDSDGIKIGRKMRGTAGSRAIKLSADEDVTMGLALAKASRQCSQ